MPKWIRRDASWVWDRVGLGVPPGTSKTMPLEAGKLPQSAIDLDRYDTTNLAIYETYFVVCFLLLCDPVRMRCNDYTASGKQSKPTQHFDICSAVVGDQHQAFSVVAGLISAGRTCAALFSEIASNAFSNGSGMATPFTLTAFCQATKQLKKPSDIDCPFLDW